MALTDAMVRNAKPKSKEYCLSDIKGLSLFVSPNGARSWHFRFKENGRRRYSSFTQYPIISLREAGGRIEDTRILIQHGTTGESG